ncbi:AAA family ATPase [Microbacterium sp. 179-I 3D4 NHS]|uniref:AAA family ATPase n=1 Tax=Microbacterium sp. 179-I 3D4 NHS TaxID=3142381 RepID=UPI0039A268CA
MTAVLIALEEPRATALAQELELEGIQVVAVTAPTASLAPLLADAEALILPAHRDVLTTDLVSACDRAGVRLLPLGDAASRLLSRFGLGTALPADAAGWQVAAALLAHPPTATVATTPHRLTAVWGPHGSPGRSTIAIQLAVELSRLGRRTALIDADTVAPSVSLLLALGDDSPGIASACRRAELGALDARELARLCTAVETSGGGIDVLPGINRPSRWPELSAERLPLALAACREWAEEAVVDVGAAFDADEEATYDVLGPRRHAATTSALREADAIIAVASADPLGISRFVRDHAELRRLTAPTPVTVVVNGLRQGPLGLDARAQIRRTLDRFAGITDVVFLPFDQRGADAALLHARPIGDVAPRSSLVAGVRRLAATMAPTAPLSPDDSSTGSSRVARLLRPVRAALAGSRRAGGPASAS